MKMYNHRNKIRLLLIEDNPGDARLIYEILKESANIEFSITHVERLEEGIKTLEEENFNVVLLDLGLPDSQGFETFYKLRNINEEVPIILLTGLDDELNAIKAVQAGAQDYLNKGDVTLGLLVRAILYSIERQELILKLRSQSIRDGLTGLYNRRGFFDLANKEFKMANRVKKDFLLIYADLDGLKKINDQFGHNIGDEAIIETSNILGETFRESDIIARIGGDEFIVLALFDNETTEEAIVSRLMTCVDRYNQKSDRLYPLSMSVGTERWSVENPIDIDTLLKNADKKMYEQKLGKAVM
jgi:two-component system, cell cycle response regulator